MGREHFNQCLIKVFIFINSINLYLIDAEREIKSIEFISSLDFEFIDNLPNDGTTYLLIFDDSCEELGRS